MLIINIDDQYTVLVEIKIRFISGKRKLKGYHTRDKTGWIGFCVDSNKNKLTILDP